jgi:hypothetical protein
MEEEYLTGISNFDQNNGVCNSSDGMRAWFISSMIEGDLGFRLVCQNGTEESGGIGLFQLCIGTDWRLGEPTGIARGACPSRALASGMPFSCAVAH